jgi:hypothetical protein
VRRPVGSAVLQQGGLDYVAVAIGCAPLKRLAENRTPPGRMGDNAHKGGRDALYRTRFPGHS